MIVGQIVLYDTIETASMRQVSGIVYNHEYDDYLAEITFMNYEKTPMFFDSKGNLDLPRNKNSRQECPIQ